MSLHIRINVAYNIYTCLHDTFQPILFLISYSANTFPYQLYAFFQQIQLPSVMHILELELAQYFCTLLAALAGRLTLLTAPNLAPVSTVCEATQTMLE